jgi:hypothetical protein
MYLDYNDIEFEGYSALANGEWEPLKLLNCYWDFGKFSKVSLNTMLSKLVTTWRPLIIQLFNQWWEFQSCDKQKMAKVEKNKFMLK